MKRLSLERPSPATVISLIALFVALGGTAYAVTALAPNSVGTKQLRKGAVTKKKLASNAVNSRKVKDSSLLAKDFKAGQLPAGPQGAQGVEGPKGDPGPTFGATQMGSNAEAVQDPAATPDETSAAATTGGRHFDFTLPAAGNLYIRFFTPVWSLDCSVGTGRFGLYLDGVPIPKTSRTLPPVGFSQARESVAVVPASAGAHEAEARYDCPDGVFTGSNTNNVPSWTVLLLGG